MTIAFAIREFEPDDFEQIERLFAKQYPANHPVLTLPYTQWLYLDNPHGRARIVTAAENGAWVGFMALLPVRLAGAGAKRAAFSIVNVLVDPQQRGKNIFADMIEHLKSFAIAEQAILIGHPNARATGAWRRAGMQFRPPLKPFIVAPILTGPRATVTEATNIAQLEPVLRHLDEQSLSDAKLRLAISSSYIEWRYFRHPNHRYRIRAITLRDEPAGFIVTRRIKAACHLLVDHFTRDGLSTPLLGHAPLLTVAFLPNKPDQPRLLRAPIKKQMPWFFSDHASPATTEIDLGLSITEF